MPAVVAALTAPAAGVDVATGVALVAAGAVALARGRGPLLVATGVAWLAGDVWSELVYAHRGPLVHLLLGRSPLTALAYLDGLIPPLARSAWLTLALAAVVVLAAAWRRGVVALVGAIAVGGALALEAIGRLVGGDTSSLAAWWYDIAVAGIGLAIAATARSKPPAAVAADLVIDLGAEPQALRSALARAVGDPTLDVAYRAGEGWTDEAGRTVRLPGSGEPRTVRMIDDVAALIHDPAALSDDTLAHSVDSALRLALANARLQADVAARVREVESSRRRLVEAAAAERRRLREQLQAGAERHLETAGNALAGLRDEADLRAELGVARADLGRFAQGIHPRALTEGGLSVALAELAAGSPFAIDLDVPADRFPGPQETVAYFVCSEALANVAKYATAPHPRVVVSADPHRLRVSIADDGPGGADAAKGSGLRGLGDRVEALGGRLDIVSPRGAGTRLIAYLPLGSMT